MDMFSDDFISYNNEVHVKLEKSSDHEISLDSPSIKTCESTPNLNPLNFSPSLQSLLTRSVSLAGIPPKKSQPFTIIKASREESEPFFEVKIESEDKILNKSKLILKREKAKQRAMTKLNKPIYLKLEADIEVSEATETCVGTGEVKNKKKVLQMIRNRISAQTSRDRKKAYLHQLEDAKNKLNSDNLVLKQQNSSLLQELAALKEANKKLLLQNEELRGEGCSNLGSAFGSESNLFNSHELNNNTLESMIKNVINCSGVNDSENPNKNKLNDVCTFATVLSTLVLNQIDSTNSGSKGKTNKDELQEETSPNKFDLKAIFNRMNNDEPIFNYTNDFMGDKQNTIFQHLSDMSKAEKKPFNKSAKENYNSNQTIFSLTNFDLTENGDYMSIKDIKQEEIQYSFGI